MRNTILLLTLFTFTIQAGDLILTPEQKDNWQIKVQAPISSQKLPLGEFIAKVVTPPSLLHSISLPFEANVKKLNVANYQYVKEGQVLAEAIEL